MHARGITISQQREHARHAAAAGSGGVQWRRCVRVGGRGGAAYSCHPWSPMNTTAVELATPLASNASSSRPTSRSTKEMQAKYLSRSADTVASGNGSPKLVATFSQPWCHAIGVVPVGQSGSAAGGTTCEPFLYPG